MEESIRVNKFFTLANYCSRREADRLIEQGRVQINNAKARLGDRVTQKDRVFVNRNEVQIKSGKKTYLAFYKPTGIICTSDKKAKDNIIDYINYPKRVYPVGRLDVKTEGLILLTNDGQIVNKILKGQNNVEKEYIVEVDKEINQAFLKTLKKGIKIDGHKTLPAKTKKLGERKFSIIIVEGKNRQIRKMCEALGYRTIMLKRIRIGNIKLENLKVGEYKKISLIGF